jgi:hypothetical protein
VTWVSETEASSLVAGYPVTIPSDYDKWLNQSYLVLSNDSRYSYPDTPTDKMKLAQSLFACDLAAVGIGQTPLQRGVQSFTIGSFSESYSQKAIDRFDEYSSTIANLIREYRVGRGTAITLSRTYPSN